MEEDTNKQKEKTTINGNTESATHLSNQENKVESKQKFHSNYGFDGLIQIFNKQEIDITNWIIEPTDKERGGFNFILPNAQGEIYLTWEDMYKTDVTFVNTKRQYNEVVSLPTLEVLINTLEEQRANTVSDLRDLLFNTFKSDKKPPEGSPF